MSQLIVSRFDVVDLSIDALRILRAAVRHAYENQNVEKHTMRIDIFCHLAGIRTTTSERFLVLLQEARKALVEVVIVDTRSQKGDDSPWGSWPVFKKIGIQDAKVVFEVYGDTLSENILAILPSPKAKFGSGKLSKKTGREGLK